jgi:hypothetical protein
MSGPTTVAIVCSKCARPITDRSWGRVPTGRVLCPGCVVGLSMLQGSR